MSETINFPEGFTSDVEYPYDENYDSKPSKVSALAEGLAEFSVWCAEHPEFVVEFLAPTWRDQYNINLRVSLSNGAWFADEGEHGMWRDRTPQEMAAEMLRVRRLAGLKSKFAQDYSVGFFQDFGPIPGVVRLVVSMPREVTCEMVDTGEVEEYLEKKVVTPAVIVEVPSTKPIMRRVCVDSLAALAHEEAAAES